MDDDVYIPDPWEMDYLAFQAEWFAEWDADFDESNVCSVPEILIDLNLSE
jgi:hypothetical protein